MFKGPRGSKWSKDPLRADYGGPEAAVSGGKDGSAPYSVTSRRERSRTLAQKRRTTYKSIMDDLTLALPFPKDVVSQLDYNSRLRLSLCFFRLKTLLANGQVESSDSQVASSDSQVASSDSQVASSDSQVAPDSNGAWSGGAAESTDVVQYQPFRLLQPGMLQSLMAEALDGFLLVASSEGTIMYLSESVHHHLGIFQSEHIGVNMYDIISEADHVTVREAVTKAEAKAMSFSSRNRGAEMEFFCRMKCSRFKVANVITKSPGFKVVFVSGSVKMMRGDNFLVTVVRPISPPSILEIRMEANMFVMHYDMEMKCIFFDGRLRPLLGWKKLDLEGISCFQHQHHEDTAISLKCAKDIVSRGETLSSYYRFLTHSGSYVWLQTRGTLMFDSRTGNPTYFVCLNYIISKEAGEKDLGFREAITTGSSGLSKGASHSYDPPPITQCTDGSVVNPLPDTSWHHKKDFFDIKDLVAGVEEGGTVKVKEEILLENGSDFGVHSNLSSPWKCSNTSNFLSTSTNPNGSPNYSNISSEGSIASLSDQTDTSNRPISPDCLPDSTSELTSASNGDGTNTISGLGSTSSSRDSQHNPSAQAPVFSFDDASSLATFLGGQASLRQAPILGQTPVRQYPLGQGPPGQVPPGQYHLGQTPPGQAPPGKVPPGQFPPGKVPPGQFPPGQAPPGQAPLGQTLLAKGLPAWQFDNHATEATSFLQPESMYQSKQFGTPVKQEQDWLSGLSDGSMTSQPFHMEANNPTFQNQSKDSKDELVHQLLEYGMNSMAEASYGAGLSELYPQASFGHQYSSAAQVNPQDSYSSTAAPINPQGSYMSSATPMNPQDSYKRTVAPIINAQDSYSSAAAPMNPQGSYSLDTVDTVQAMDHQVQFDQLPFGHPTNQGEFHANAAWEVLPQLTGEDLDML